MMIFVFSSLKSFCAPRQTPEVALSMMTAYLRSVVYLQILGGTQRGGVTGFSSLDLLFYMDMVSRYGVGSFKKIKVHTVDKLGQQKEISFKKSSLISIYLFSAQCSNLLVEFIKQMFTCRRCKKSGCVREGLDLEAKV